MYLPSGGSVPSSTTLTNGGVLDGVTGGEPWDVACHVQWRVVTFRNNATTGVRDTLVDGVVVPGSQITATTVAIPSGASLRVTPDASCSLAEVVGWNTVLTDAEVRQLVPCHRTKWSVVDLQASPLSVLPLLSHTGMTRTQNPP